MLLTKLEAIVVVEVAANVVVELAVIVVVEKQRSSWSK